jgi:hypothetical protein
MGWVVSITPRPRFTPGERTPGTHCAGGWVGPRAGLDTKDRGKILCPRRGSSLDRPVVQPVLNKYSRFSCSRIICGVLRRRIYVIRPVTCIFCNTFCIGYCVYAWYKSTVMLLAYWNITDNLCRRLDFIQEKWFYKLFSSRHWSYLPS